jgi:hypothetical protein
MLVKADKLTLELVCSLIETLIKHTTSLGLPGEYKMTTAVLPGYNVQFMQRDQKNDIILVFIRQVREGKISGRTFKLEEAKLEQCCAEIFEFYTQKSF